MTLTARTNAHRREPVRKAPADARRRLGALMVAFGIAVILGIVLVPGESLTFPSTADEVKQGGRIAHQIETHYQIVTDPAEAARVNRVGSVLADVVARRDLAYHFQIVSANDVASVAVPGGWVYVTEGMLAFVRTDDELAAVLGHELAHIDHHHYYVAQDEMRHHAGSLFGATAVPRGPLSGYPQDLEQDADLTTVEYLTKTSYSPVAMLTVLQHLVQVARLSGQLAGGGATGRDRSPIEERIESLQAELTQRHIPIIMRIPAGYLKITLDPPATPGDEPVTILVDGGPVLTLGAPVGGQRPLQRAQAVAEQLNAFLNKDPISYDVHVTTLLGRTSVIGGQTVLYTVAPEDAAYAHVEPRVLGESMRSGLARAIAKAPYNQRF